MKKTLISTLLASTFGLLSLQATAADLQEIYQLAVQKDPTVLRAAATRDGGTGAATCLDPACRAGPTGCAAGARL